MNNVVPSETVNDKPKQDGNNDLMYGLSVVIPAYNEEDRIVPILYGLTRDDFVKEIIVVFDGNDGTEQVAKSFGDKVKVYTYSSKLGRGGAVIEGLKHLRIQRAQKKTLLF